MFDSCHWFGEIFLRPLKSELVIQNNLNRYSILVNLKTILHSTVKCRGFHIPEN